MIYMATFCSKRESREKNNCRLSEEFQDTRPMKLPGNFGLTRPFCCHSTGLVRQSLSPKIVPQNFLQMHQWEQSWSKGKWKDGLCVRQRMFRGHNTDTGL